MGFSVLEMEPLQGRIYYFILDKLTDRKQTDRQHTQTDRVNRQTDRENRQTDKQEITRHIIHFTAIITGCHGNVLSW